MITQTQITALTHFWLEAPNKPGNERDWYEDDAPAADPPGNAPEPWPDDTEIEDDEESTEA